MRIPKKGIDELNAGDVESVENRKDLCSPDSVHPRSKR